MEYASPALGLAGWILASFLAAAAGVRFRPDAWFATLRKPAWNPPGWVFAPVWTVLYTMMGVAAWLVWREGGFALRSVPLWLFVVQLLLNALWTPIFFGARRPGIALLDIATLWVLLVLATAFFWQVSTLAGGLMLPYLAWVTFASALNFSIWRMNRFPVADPSARLGEYREQGIG